MNMYAIGEFAAETMLNGIIQPDFKMDNLGINGSRIVFVFLMNSIMKCYVR